MGEIGSSDSKTWDCGAVPDTVSATLHGDTLTISGSGTMKEYEPKAAPWYDLCETITAIVIEEGVTTIEGHPFWGCSGVMSFTCVWDTWMTIDAFRVLVDCTILPMANVNVTDVPED